MASVDGGAKRASEIPTKMNELDNMIARTYDVAARVADRVKPILRNEPPNAPSVGLAAPGSRVSPNTELGCSLENFVSRLDDILTILENVNSSLEI